MTAASTPTANRGSLLAITTLTLALSGCAELRSFDPPAPALAPPPPPVQTPAVTASPPRQRPIARRARPIEAPRTAVVRYAPGEWLLAEAALLKTEPARGSEALFWIPVGGSVIAQGSTVNAEGTWWFVSHRGRAGWLRESALNGAGRP